MIHLNRLSGIGLLGPSGVRYMRTGAGLPIAVVTGASGELGHRLVVDLTNSQHFSRVVGITSNASRILGTSGHCKVDQSRLVLVDRTSRNLNDNIATALGDRPGEVVVINTIGGTPKGICKGYTADDLRKVNSDPSMNMVRSIAKAAERVRAGSLGVIHVSSITASLRGLPEKCDYARERLSTEEGIKQYINTLPMPSRLAVLRVGFVIQPITKSPCGKLLYDTGYTFGQHHMSHKRVVFGYGHGMHPMQPVHMDDIVSAVEKMAADSSINGVINGVDTDEGVPFIHFISHLNPRLKDGRLFALLIPHEIAGSLAQIASTGHNQPYAVNFTQQQDILKAKGEPQTLEAGEFKKLLGREPIKYQHQFHGIEESIVCPKLDHLKLLRAAFANLSATQLASMVKILVGHARDIKIVRVTSQPR